MKKVLFTSHTANFAKFNIPMMQWFAKQGWQVHYASMGEEEVYFCDRHFQVDFSRSPYSRKNVAAYRQLKNIIDREQYDIIHCHTPVGGVVTRLAAMNARKKGTKILYTAHGFHFYKGAPLRNWIMYYSVEKLLARVTDCLIVINDEDYAMANRYNFAARKIEKVNGVGVDLTRFHPIGTAEANDLRAQYGFANDDLIIIYVAELTQNKNHKFLIDCARQIRVEADKTHFLFVGSGAKIEYWKRMVSKDNMDDYIHFLGYRDDVARLYQLSDMMVSSSKREGLPISIIEGMATGLPVICTRIRGHVDIIKDNHSGILYPVNDKKKFCDTVKRLCENPEERVRLGQMAKEDVEKFSVDLVMDQMKEIYRNHMLH